MGIFQIAVFMKISKVSRISKKYCTVRIFEILMYDQLNKVVLLFLSGVLVKFYCNIITRSCLQLIDTLIDTFFIKLHAFLMQQRRTRKANDG